MADRSYQWCAAIAKIVTRQQACSQSLPSGFGRVSASAHGKHKLADESLIGGHRRSSGPAVVSFVDRRKGERMQDINETEMTQIQGGCCDGGETVLPL